MIRIPTSLPPGALARIAGGRTLVVDYLATRCCTAVTVGDARLRWAGREARPVGFEPLEPTDGVEVVANPRLIGLLREAGPTIEASWPTWRGRIRLRLDAPERWLDFLASGAASRGRA